MPKFREISGQFVGYVPDGTDPDVNPDREAMNGRVTFTPVFTGGVIAFPELSPPEFAHPEPISARIIDGFVQVQVGTDDDVSMQPLSLMVTVDDEATQTWSWRAEFTNMRIGNGEAEVQIPSWSFRVPDGSGPVDLTELVPLKTSATVDVTKGPRGAGLENITAVDGQLVFEYTDGQESTVPIPEAVQGPQGEPGPAGADGEQGPQGEKGDPGEIPDLLVGNITDATPTGKNLMLAATEGAARNALGLQAGATTIAGAYSELKPGSTQTNSRVWSPKNISDYVEERAQTLVSEAKLVANVKDYGAVGDGENDDSVAAQAAMDDLSVAGGGVLVFPGGGTYRMHTPVELTSNVRITASGATLLKKYGNAGYSVFVSRSNGATGYGSGATNVHFDGGTYSGSFESGAKTGVSIGLHHAKGVRVTGVTFTQSILNGHSLDLAGCEDVLIEDCTFEGWDVVTDREYVEAIQLDYSMRSALNIEDLDASYDGVATRNVTVRDCRFVPLAIGSTTYPAPVALGNHARVADIPITNIRFEGNLVDGGRQTDDLTEGTAAYFNGWVHLFQIVGAKIVNNTFIAPVDSGGTRVINMHAPGTGTAIEDIAYASPSSVNVTPIPPTDILVQGNTFSGFDAANTERVVFISGYSASIPASGVRVSDNQFVDCSPSAEGDYSPDGQYGVGVEKARDVTISRNTFNGVFQAVRAVTVTQFRVEGNSVRGVTKIPVEISSGRGVVVSGNTFRSQGGVWANDVKEFVVSSNHMEAPVMSGGTSVSTAFVNATGCKNLLVSGNSLASILGNTYMTRAVAVYGASTQGRVTGNVVAGFSADVVVSGDSTSIIVADNLLSAS